MSNLDALLPYRTDFPEAIAALEEWQRDALARRARLSLDGTPLSIGIMGQVKAGKSSFLNMLLFGGKPLLPEAATPKTATLTRIRYGEMPRFVACFYTADEWAQIERLAASAVSDESTRIAKELVAQAAKQQDKTLPAQTQHSIEAEHIDALLGRINDFTGSDGRSTHWVKHCELFLPMPELQGIEIVDTPGMNDPVCSRADKSREYMAQCDVVFFLSRASQFFDATDRDLMAQQLPQKGVKRLVLVASQFDSVVLDDGYDRNSLSECVQRVRDKLTRQAARNVEDWLSNYEKSGHAAATSLRTALTQPLFISTYAQAFMTLPESEWSRGQHHVHGELQELARSCWNTARLVQTNWEELSGFAQISATYHSARAEKDAILAEQRKYLEQELQQHLDERLEALRVRAEDRLATLQHGDLTQLAERERATRARIHTIAQALAQSITSVTTAAHEHQQEIIADLRADAARASDVQERTGYRTRSYRVKVSGPVWWNPFTWFSKTCYESYSETSSYRYVATSDAIENLRNYTENARRQLCSVFASLEPAAISLTLRKALLQVIDFQDKEIDPRMLRTWVEDAIATLQLPRLEFAAPDVSAIFGSFDKELTSSSEIASLRQRLTDTVEAINRKLAEAIDAGVTTVCQQLDAIAAGLSAKLTAHLDLEIDRLQAAFADKARQIERMQALLRLLPQAAEAVNG